jgi:hypothetical protein
VVYKARLSEKTGILHPYREPRCIAISPVIGD